MPITFLFLQLVNLVLAAASAWIHFRNPALWDDQALVIATVAGTAMACFTAIALGLHMLLAKESTFKFHAIHLLLTLLFAAGQGYLLFLMSKDIGLFHLIKMKLGL